MKRFLSTKRYTAIGDGSAGGRSTSHPLSSEFELEDRVVSSRSPSHASDEDPRSQGKKRDSVVTLSEVLDNSLSANIGAGKVRTGFSPLFTRRWILFCFAVLWVLIFVSLQLIFSISEANDGLATADKSLHYVWTYGPTAVLIICTVLWRQVDYAAKYIQPWAMLAKGPRPAEQTLLLNYITELQIVAFWKALRLRHVTVASTILIFVLIKVLTIVSTGLFVLLPTPFEGILQEMQATTTFDASAGLPNDKIDSRAAVALFGHREYKMLLPNGTMERYAHQLFEPTIELSDDIEYYNASVDVFTADGWDCESGDLTYEIGLNRLGVGDFAPEMTGVSSYYNTSIKLPDCDIQNAYLDAPSWFYVTNDTTTYYGYWGAFQHVNCSNLEPSDSKFNRYLIAVTYSRGVGQNDNTMLNSSHVVCRPSYKVQPGYVTLFANGSRSDNVAFSGNSRQLDEVTADDVAMAVRTTIKQTSIPPEFSTYNITTDGFLNNMIALTPDFQWEMLLNDTWLSDKSLEVYQQTAAQVAGLYLLRPDDQASTLQGTLGRTEQRLFVRELPARLMQACVAIMLVLTITMLFTIPQEVVPRPIESVASVAVILARSPSLVNLLRNTGHLNAHQLRVVLSDYRFMSTVANAPEGRTFSIRVLAKSGVSAPSIPSKHIKWTQPLVLRRLVMILTLLLAVAVLIALEVLYRTAQASNGLADVDVSSLQRYIWTYTPTVVLVLLATTFNILDFELEFADPYHELSRGDANASSSLLWDPLRNITLQTCFHALQHARFALVASSISVILAPMLTIVVSGLFIAQSVPRNQDVQAKADSWFNLSSSSDYGITSLAGTFALPALILQGNMSYPQWTLGELAFPSIDLSGQSMGLSNTSDGSLSINIPAARGSVNCTRVPDSQFNSLEYGQENADYAAFNISMTDGCGNGGWIDGDMIWLSGSTAGPTSGTGYLGGITSGAGEITRPSDNATVQCPQYIATFGRVESQNITAYNVFFCTTGLEAVQTKATIDMNLATITSISEVDEKSTKSFNSYWAPSLYSIYFIPINLTNPDESLDDYVTAMVHGKDGVPSAELLKDPNTFINQFTHTYRQWTAQWLNIHFREPTTSLSQNTSNIAGGTLPTTLSAVYADPNRQRLFLSEISTRILQAIIATLILCGITIFFLVDMSRVLPKNVASIAAVASLLAGSRFVDEKSGLIPRGSEWMSDTTIRKSGIWNGEKFRMGWWDDGQDEDFSVAVDGDRYEDGLEEQKQEQEVDEKSGQFRIDAVSRGRS